MVRLQSISNSANGVGFVGRWFNTNRPGVLVREETFANPQALTDWLKANPDPMDVVG